MSFMGLLAGAGEGRGYREMDGTSFGRGKNLLLFDLGVEKKM